MPGCSVWTARASAQLMMRVPTSAGVDGDGFAAMRCLLLEVLEVHMSRGGVAGGGGSAGRGACAEALFCAIHVSTVNSKIAYKNDMHYIRFHVQTIRRG